MFAHMHADTHTPIVTATVWRRESLLGGEPLALPCPSPPLSSSSFPPSFPFLQARVMSLSPDSWHVNEDVMRLADMQLI